MKNVYLLRNAELTLAKISLSRRTGLILEKIPLRRRSGLTLEKNPLRRRQNLPASFTVEASLLMTIILPVLLAILYYGFFLHDKGVLNGASQQITAQADLNNYRSSGNNRLGKQAKKLEKRTAPSRNVSSSVSVSRTQASVTYSGTISLPSLLSPLFGRNRLDTGASAKRTLLHPADIIRTIRGLEYVSSLLKGGS